MLKDYLDERAHKLRKAQKSKPSSSKKPKKDCWASYKRESAETIWHTLVKLLLEEQHYYTEDTIHVSLTSFVEEPYPDGYFYYSSSSTTAFRKFPQAYSRIDLQDITNIILQIASKEGIAVTDEKSSIMTIDDCHLCFLNEKYTVYTFSYTPPSI